MNLKVPINQLVDFGNNELRAAVPFNISVNVEIRLQKLEQSSSLPGESPAATSVGSNRVPASADEKR